MTVKACAACKLDLPASSFTKGQLKKGALRRCTACVAVAPFPSTKPVEDAAAASSSSVAGTKLLAHDLAAQVVAAVDCGGSGGVRTALYSLGPRMPNKIKPTVTALVSEVLRELPSLRAALASVKGPWTTDKSQEHLAAVFAHEIVVRRRAVKGGARHAICRAVWEQRDAIRKALPAGAPDAEGTSTAPPPSAKKLPRYVRVNTLKTSVADVQASLAGTVSTSDEDPLVPTLLQLPPKTNLHGHPLVESGQLILQDRASCLPALALSPPPGAVVIDACAAPGNKTTQLASMVGPAGRVFAFERNARRAQTLRRMVNKAGAGQIVRVCEADFTAARDDGDRGGGIADRATMALCDPSCSGSGGAGGHYDLHGGGGEQSSVGGSGSGGAARDAAYWDHVHALAASQREIVLAAMAYPRVTTVVYSTCSVHREENEDVVAAVLAASAGAWRVVRCMPTWPTRGLVEAPHGPLCVRAGADDGTHGFFVARFERQPHGEAQSQGQGRRCEASTADAAAKSVEPHKKKKKKPRIKP